MMVVSTLSKAPQVLKWTISLCVVAVVLASSLRSTTPTSLRGSAYKESHARRRGQFVPKVAATQQPQSAADFAFSIATALTAPVAALVAPPPQAPTAAREGAFTTIVGASGVVLEQTGGLGSSTETVVNEDNARDNAIGVTSSRAFGSSTIKNAEDVAAEKKAKESTTTDFVSLFGGTSTPMAAQRQPSANSVVGKTLTFEASGSGGEDVYLDNVSTLFPGP